MENTVTGVVKGHKSRKVGNQERSTKVVANEEKIYSVVIWPTFENDPLHSHLATKPRMPWALLCDQCCELVHIAAPLILHVYKHTHTRTYQVMLVPLFSLTWRQKATTCTSTFRIPCLPVNSYLGKINPPSESPLYSFI